MTTDRPLSEDLQKLARSGGPEDLVYKARAISDRQKTAGSRKEAMFASKLAEFYEQNVADCAPPNAMARRLSKDIREGRLESGAQQKKVYEILRKHAAARLEISNPDYFKITI